jgi:hypothetical protein
MSEERFLAGGPNRESPRMIDVMASVKSPAIERNSREHKLMSKKKQDKKKERERRVAQKKHADAEKRAQLATADETPKALPKTNLFTGSVTGSKTKALGNKKRPCNYRRSGGG